MASQVKVKTARFDATKYHGLDRDALIRIYRTMFLSRRLDDREIQLKRQNKIFFQISGAGHEAVLVAAGLLLKPGYDWFFPYYRDRALALTLGVTPYEMLLQARWRDGRSFVRRAADAFALGQPAVEYRAERFVDRDAMAARGGRGGGVALLREIPEGAGAGAQGAAGRFAEPPPRRDCVRFRRRRLDQRRRIFRGAECGVPAARRRCCFLVEDNGYAISVPVEAQTAGGNISKLAANFPNFAIEECDGTDPLESYAALGAGRGALPRAARTGAGPRACDASLFAFAFRRRKALQDGRRARRGSARAIPCRNSGCFWCAKGFSTKASWRRSKPKWIARCWRRPTARWQRSRRRPIRFTRTFIRRMSIRRARNSMLRRNSPACRWRAAVAKTKTMVEMVSATLADEMARDERDRGVRRGRGRLLARRRSCRQVKGKGGVFKATAGLQRRFRLDARVQFADRGGGDRGPRAGHGACAG